MAEKKQEPDTLLQEFHNDIHAKNQGKLKIFLGYAEGAGKTYAMLQAAHQAKEHGIDVVAGYIETHNSPQTELLLEELEQIKLKQVSLGDTTGFEFDIDTANSTKKHDTIKVTPDASPSSPSVKFTAFTVPIMNIIINRIYHIPKLIIWFVNGITSCVALGDALY